MTESDHTVLETVAEIEPAERRLHREFLHRHIDAVTDILVAEEVLQQRQSPCGCPAATPATVAHRRETDSDPWPCAYERIDTLDTATPRPAAECACGDPLAGSDDPLDTVAAAVLAERNGVIARYFDQQERALVAALRTEVGDWEDIYALGLSALSDVCDSLGPGYGVRTGRLARLQDALDIIAKHRYTEGVTLRDLSHVQYSQLQELFVTLPSIARNEAWWLVMAALDKPVWPAAPEIDRLLVDLGLLSLTAVRGDASRYESLEGDLTPRQILPLHRSLAAHSRLCGTTHATAACELRKFTLSYRARQQRCASDGPTVVDLFAGAGGLSHGFRAAGCRIGFATDKDEAAMDTYRLNHPEVPHQQVQCADINDLTDGSGAAEHLPDDVDILVGGPPCQALSVAGYRSRLADDEQYSIIDDPRTQLYQRYIDILEETRPSVILMENVEGILNEIGDTDCRVIDDVRDELASAGYSTDAQLVDCSQFGLPQERERVFVIGVRDTEFSDPEQRVQQLFERLEAAGNQHPPSLKQALSNLPRLRRGEGGLAVAGRAPGRPSDYVQTNGLADGTALTYNHLARKHPMEKDRTLFDEVMEPGDTGWDVKYRKGRDDLIEYNVGTEDQPEFKDKYRMLHWTEPSPTIVAHLQKDSNSFILPDYYQSVQDDADRANDRRNRGLTPREAARIQSFPDSHIFLGPFTSQFRQIGNAVPPLVGETIATILTEQLAPETGEQIENRSQPTSRAAMTDD